MRGPQCVRCRRAELANMTADVSAQAQSYLQALLFCLGAEVKVRNRIRKRLGASPSAGACTQSASQELGLCGPQTLKDPWRVSFFFQWPLPVDTRVPVRPRPWLILVQRMLAIPNCGYSMFLKCQCRSLGREIAVCSNIGVT